MAFLHFSYEINHVHDHARDVLSGFTTFKELLMIAPRVYLKKWATIFVTGLALFLTTLNFAHAESLADKLRKELGSKPSRANLIKVLKKNLPEGTEISPEDVLMPKEYMKILFGSRYAEFIQIAQDTNPFLHKEANESGFMVSQEVDELDKWPFNPIKGEPFLVPRFLQPAEKVQIGHLADASEISEDIAKHMLVAKSVSKPQQINFWIHPDDPTAYDDFVYGGKSGKPKGVPAKGYGIEWDYVGVAFNGPRSLLMISLNNPDLDPILVKVNLHRKLEGSTRIIPPHKAARSVLATRLLQDNMTPSLNRKWGFDFLPEVGAWSLGFSKRSNVVRDPALFVKSNKAKYVYAYSPFSPTGVESVEDILAVKWLGRNPTKAKFEKLARKIFRLMARPFAYHALVTGLNFEWHSANWLIAYDDNGPLDHVLLQDMEALRFDAQIGIWNGGNASALQTVSQPWLLAKYSNALGGNWESVTKGERTVDYRAPEFLADEYLWRVRGLKDTKSAKEPTTKDNLWGYSTIVDVARNFGVGVMGYKLTNAEVERWMDEEMADAFNDVLRNELQITEDEVASVTAEQMLREVKLTKDYETASFGIGIPRGIETVHERIHKEGGITRVLWQVRNILDAEIASMRAKPELQELLAAEAQRLRLLKRNTRINWNEIESTNDNQRLLFHEKSRVIELRNDADGWLGFFALEPDGSPGTIEFMKNFKSITGRYPKTATTASLSTCRKLLSSTDVKKRGFSFGDRTGLGEKDAD